MEVTDITLFKPDTSEHYNLSLKDNTSSFSKQADFIANISSCTYFSFENDKFNTVPAEIGKIEKLRTLHIKLPEIESLPKEIFTNSIEYLTIEADIIHKLPDELWNQKIDSLKIITKELKTLPAPAGYIAPDFRTIHLEIGNLTAIPKVLFNSSAYGINIISKSRLNLSGIENINNLLMSINIYADNIESVSSINECKALTRLNLRSVKSTNMETVNLPETITDLVIHSPETNLPDLSKLVNLASISIHGIKGNLNNGIGSCKELKSLAIADSEIIIDDELAKCQNLNRINIFRSIDTFPMAIMQLANLEYLRLNDNRFKSLPNDWSGLKNLKELDINNNPIEIVSFEFLSQLPALKTISFGPNAIKNRYVFLSKKKIPLQAYQLNKFGIKANQAEVPAVGAALAKAKLSEEVKHEFLDHFWENGELHNLAISDNQHLVQALQINYTPLKNELTKYLNKFIEEHSGKDSISDKSIIHIAGKPFEKLAKLKEMIDKTGASFSAALSSKVTHIVIARKPDNADIFNSSKFKYLHEAELIELAEKTEPKFLHQQAEQGNDAVLDNVSAMLNSPEPANVQIGLQMMKTGGIPEKLLDSVLMIAKSDADAKNRKEAKAMLNQSAPASWRLLIDDKQLFKNLNSKVREQEISNKLKTIEKNAGINNAGILSLALFKRHRKGLRFLITKAKLSSDLKKKTYEAILTDGCLDYAAGLAYKNWKDKDPSEMILTPQKIKHPFPAELPKWFDFEDVNFHNSKFDAIPKDIAIFSKAKRIDFSCNFLSKLPAYFAKLDQLEEIDFSYNCFEEFPEVLLKIPSLKKIDLRNCLKKGEPTKLTISNEIREQMPDCNILI